MIVLCLREPPGGFYDVVLHSCLFFLCWLLCISGLLFPCHRHSELYSWYFSLLYFSVYNERYEFEWAFFTLRSFPTFLSQPAFTKASRHSELYSWYFSLLYFSVYNERYEFEWAFFTLRSFPTFLSQPAFTKASLGAGSCSLKFAGLHVDHRNVDPTHLFV